MGNWVVQALVGLLRSVGAAALARAFARRLDRWSAETRRDFGSRLQGVGRLLVEGKTAQAAEALAGLLQEAR